MSGKNESSAKRNARRRWQRENLRQRIAELEGRPGARPRDTVTVTQVSTPPETTPPAPRPVAPSPPAYTGPRRVLICTECEGEFPVSSMKPRLPICPACSTT